MPSQHSKFGASSAARFLACPASFRAGEDAKKTGMDSRRAKSSDYADEGTAAHLLAEMCLTSNKTTNDFVGQQITLGHRPDRPFSVTSDFAEDVDVYVDLVKSFQLLGCDVSLEQTVEPAWAWTGDLDNPQDPDLPFDLFGTADCVAVRPVPGTIDNYELRIADLKFGRGVVVEAKNNAQLRYYALGALRRTMLQGKKIASVTMFVVQPRAYHKDGPVRHETLTTQELLDWARRTLKPGIDRALEPDQPYASGEHCRFCPAILTCPEAAKAALNTARAAFQNAPVGADLNALIAAGHAPDKEELRRKSLAELDQLYQHYELTSMAMNALQSALKEALTEASLQEIQNLKHVKPVQTPTRRVWADTTRAIDLSLRVSSCSNLETAREVVDPAKIMARGVARTPAQTAKILKRAGADPQEVEKYVETIPGQMTVAPKDDPRPVYATQAQKDVPDITS